MELTSRSRGNTINPKQAKRMKDRTVHLVDLENLVGSGHLTEHAAHLAFLAYSALGVVSPGDLVILGVSHHNLIAASYGWPHVRCRARSGPDGADLLLQEVMTDERIEERFGAAIVATGDGGFAEAIASLIGRGLPVGVIAPAGRISTKLRLAASAVCEIHFDVYSTSRSA